MTNSAGLSPLLTTPINSESLVRGIWDKYFASLHGNIIKTLRNHFKNDSELQSKLTSAFPGYSWAEFADMPTQNTFVEIKTAVEDLMSIPDVARSSDITSAIKEFMAQYNLMLHNLSQPQANKSKAPQSSPKIKQIQQMLGLQQTGLWDQKTNAVFLDWLKENGWSNYISGNKFVGSIDDAVRALLVDKVGPKPQPIVDTTKYQQRQANRLKSLRKFANDIKGN